MILDFINVEYKDRKLMFKLGTNLEWIELHLLENISKNIEIEIGQKIDRNQEVKLFDPDLDQNSNDDDEEDNGDNNNNNNNNDDYDDDDDDKI